MASLIILKVRNPAGAILSTSPAAGETAAAASKAAEDAAEALAGTAGKGPSVADVGRGLYGALTGAAGAFPAALLVSVGLSSAKAAFAKWNATAQQDEGWARASAAVERLALSIDMGILSSQVVQASLDLVSRTLVDTADRLEKWASGPEPFGAATRAWASVKTALGGFNDRFTAVADVVMGRFHLALLDLANSIAVTADIKVRSRAEASIVSQDPNRPEVVSIISFPGSGDQYVEPQNRMFGDRGTAQPEGIKNLSGAVEDVAAEKAAVLARIDAAKARLEGYLGLKPGALGGKPQAPAPPRASTPSDAPASLPEAAGAAVETSAEKLAAWCRSVSSSSPAQAVVASLDTAMSAGQERLSAAFARVREIATNLRAGVLGLNQDFAVLAASTEALAAGFEAVAQQAEQIGASNTRVAQMIARAEMIAVGIFAATEAAIEIAAGIAAAIALDVGAAIQHFVAAALYATAAAIATGRGVGAIRSPREAREIAQRRLDGIRGAAGGGFASSRMASLVLTIDGDVDLERDPAWARRNILEPIASAGKTPPADGGFGDFPTIRVRKPGLGRTIELALRARFNQTYGGQTNQNALYGELAALVALGPYGAVAAAGYFVGRYLGDDIARAGTRAGNEARRFGRRIRRIF